MLEFLTSVVRRDLLSVYSCEEEKAVPVLWSALRLHKFEPWCVIRVRCGWRRQGQGLCMLLQAGNPASV